MTKRSRSTSRGTAPPPEDTSTGAGTGTCDSYAPGHHIFYLHQGTAIRSPSLVVQDAFLDDSLVMLALQDGRHLRWRHHDPERLDRALGLLRSSTRVHLDHHALRVGPYWFNCASELDAFEDCRRHEGGDVRSAS